MIFSGMRHHSAENSEPMTQITLKTKKPGLNHQIQPRLCTGLPVRRGFELSGSLPSYGSVSIDRYEVCMCTHRLPGSVH